MSAKNISHFKKRPLAQIMAVAFSLTAGFVSNSAFAQAALPCNISGPFTTTGNNQNFANCLSFKDASWH